MAKILITGGSGSIGRKLIPRLKESGHEVAVIGRSRYLNIGAPSFTWDLAKHEMEEGALDGVTHIIHLAGAGIADKPWSPERKQEILESRVRPLQLLADNLTNRNQKIEAIISSSAVGYYGAITSGKTFTEEDSSASDFLGITCQMWEDAVQLLRPCADREVRIRTGVFLMKEGGALEKIAKPIRLGVGAPLGSGKQWVPWIHVDDLVEMYVRAVEDKNLHGAFNGVAPESVNQKGLTRAIGDVLRKPLFLPAASGFVLKLMLGQMACIVTEGSRVSSEKIQATGFQFKFSELKSALNDLLR